MTDKQQIMAEYYKLGRNDGFFFGIILGFVATLIIAGCGLYVWGLN